MSFINIKDAIRIGKVGVATLLLFPLSLFAQETKPTLRYVGSSTIANFLRDAEPVYNKVKFNIDSEPESAGGEQAIMEGRADIAGVARVPKSETLGKGVFSTLIGWDAIAVVVNETNPVSNLTNSQLKDIFTGKIRNWKEVGGEDREIHPYIVGFESATRRVFRSVVLGEEDYINCKVVSPDVNILVDVKNDPGAIGQISFSFLSPNDFIKPIAVDEQQPVLSNRNYPITRPLFLLWWGRERVENFINWINSDEGQAILQRRFITTRGSKDATNALPTIKYVGSSTVGIFMQNASAVYRKANFQIHTEPESSGGEQAIVKGETGIAGIANLPQSTTLQAGIVSTLIARDAISVIVHSSNNIKNLSIAQLHAVFTGKITNWKELGGHDLLIQPFVVGQGSATRKVFQEIVLNKEEYAGCYEIKPDPDIINAVADNPGAIGQISIAFLSKTDNVHTISVGKQSPGTTNLNYPITRPLYLLWKEGNPEIEEFVEWAQSNEAQSMIMQHFIGTRIVGTPEQSDQTGTLVVYTETTPVEDGGVFYYPHLPYVILTPKGELVLRVQNNMGDNDENPTQVSLPSGSYLIRPETNTGKKQEFFVNIEANKVTRVNVEEIQGRGDVPISETDEKKGEDRQLAEVLDRYKSLKLYGDFRFRGEHDWDSRKTDGSFRDDRSRFRYRLRIGFTYRWSEHISFGARIRSGVPANLQSPHNSPGYKGFSSLPINIDKAYLLGRYKNYWWWAGKNGFPFWKQNELFWDDDVTTAGIAVGGTFSLNKINIKPKGVYFLANELPNSNGGIDGTITAGQLELNYNQNKSRITIASGYYQMNNLNNVPETDDLFTGTRYTLDYKFIVSGLKLSFKTKYPMVIGLDHFINLEDYSADTLMNDVYKNQKTGYVGSIQLGRLKDKGDWLIGYYYVRKEELSVVSYYAEDDFVRWGNINRNRNTNYSGHEIRLAYAFGSKFNVVARAYSVNGLVTTKTDTETGNRFRIDFNIKF